MLGEGAITNDDLRRVAAAIEGRPFTPERELRCGMHDAEGLPCFGEPVESLVPIYGDQFPPFRVCERHLRRFLVAHLLVFEEADDA